MDPPQPDGSGDGLTAVAIIYSPAGQRSGAHMNPAVTMAFFRLGKIRQTDAGAYIAAHFIGAVLGLVVISARSSPRDGGFATGALRHDAPWPQRPGPRVHG